MFALLSWLQRVQAFTRNAVQMEAEKGGAFVLFGGVITGKFTELVSRELCSRVRWAKIGDTKLEEGPSPGCPVAKFVSGLRATVPETITRLIRSDQIVFLASAEFYKFDRVEKVESGCLTQEMQMHVLSGRFRAAVSCHR